MRRFFVPTLLCMAMFPKLVCAYGEYVDTGVNYGGHGNVPWNGDYGNVDVPSGHDVYVGSEVPRNAYGGYAQNGTVENNRLTIVGTHVGEAYGAYVRIQGDVSHNRVSVSGGSYVGGFVMGGQTDNGNAIDNHVVMTGSESMSALFGGFSYSDGVVQGNSVTMEDGIVGREVMGGYSYQGNAVGNVVVIRGGRVDMDVIGGASGHGNATDNQVVIAGAPVLMADVYGGSVETASAAAINNTVTLATDAGAHLENRTIYGGFRYLPGNQGTGDVVSGNKCGGCACGGQQYREFREGQFSFEQCCRDGYTCTGAARYRRYAVAGGDNRCVRYDRGRRRAAGERDEDRAGRQR